MMIAAKTKQAAARRVPHWRWQGIGFDLIVHSHERTPLRWYERFLCFFLLRLYGLDNEAQKSFFARSVGQFWDYMLNNSEGTSLLPSAFSLRLPSCIMDIFFALPDALQRRVPHARCQARPQTPEEAPALGEALAGRRDLVKGGLRHSAEELRAVLAFLQHLPKSSVQEFLREALPEKESDAVLQGQSL